MPTVTRREIVDILQRWHAGDILAREVFDWAQERYWPDEIDFDDWEGDSSSVANEVMALLDQLPIHLILPEDIPVYLEFLASPPGQFSTACQRFRQELDRINYAARVRALSEDEFYGPFLGRARNA